MKNFIFAFLFVITGSLLVSTNTAQAQDSYDVEYLYSDVNTGVIYQLYLRFSGYQVQVWMKNNSQSDWTEADVTYSSDEAISYTLSGTKYHIELDPYNEDAVILYNSDYSSSWKYYLKN